MKLSDEDMKEMRDAMNAAGLAHEFAELEQRLEAAENDAARYRYVLFNMIFQFNGMDGESKWFFSIGKRDEPYPKNSPYYKGKPFKSVTEAIDAAMKENRYE